MSICTLDCLDENNLIPASYDEGKCAPVLRDFGYKTFILIKCGFAFTNILDAAEWDAAIAAGDIIAGPKFGNLAFGDETVDTWTDGCGTQYPTNRTTPITFTTPSTCLDYSDEDWWYFFDKSFTGYTFIAVDCNGRLKMDDTTVTAIKDAQAGGVTTVAASNIGFTLSVPTPPKFGEGPNGVGKFGIWTVGLEITSNCILRSVEIPGVSL